MFSRTTEKAGQTTCFFLFHMKNRAEIIRFRHGFVCFQGSFVEAPVKPKLARILFDTNFDTNAGSRLVLFVARFLALYISGWWKC